MSVNSLRFIGANLFKAKIKANVVTIGFLKLIVRIPLKLCNEYLWDPRIVSVVDR